jgi:F-type H+-transporting ATPase subunit epsilon
MVMDIRVLTPDRVICSTTANEVILPGLTGQVGVLDGHTALITALDTGLLRIKLDEKWTPIILCGGLAEIDQNRVTVLVNDVEELTNVKLSEATKELEKATLAVETAETSKDRLDASVELKKASFHGEIVAFY